ncbi:MAG TPA: hypothetical protein VGE02_09460, partial [Gemmatimonadales bacterium]
RAFGASSSAPPRGGGPVNGGNGATVWECPGLRQSLETDCARIQRTHSIASAALLVELWLEARPDADEKGQDMVPAERGALREVFKYFTKLVTKARTKDRVTTAVAPIAALDVIFSAMRGRRVYQPVGFKLPRLAKDEEGKDIGTDGHTPVPHQVVKAEGYKNADGKVRIERPGYSGAVWSWSQDAADWVLPDTGEALTGYQPSSAMRGLVRSVEAQADSGGEASAQGPNVGPEWDHAPEARKEETTGADSSGVSLDHQRPPAGAAFPLSPSPSPCVGTTSRSTSSERSRAWSPP